MASIENKDELSLDEHIHEVAEALSDIQIKWYQLGVQLRVPTAALDQIEHEYSKNLGRALLEMLKKWFKMVGPRTWTAIVDALKRKAVDEGTLANVIEDKHVNCNKSLAETTRSMSEPCERDFGSVKDSLIQRTMSDGVTSLKAPASHSRDEKATRSNQALPEPKRSPGVPANSAFLEEVRSPTPDFDGDSYLQQQSSSDHSLTDDSNSESNFSKNVEKLAYSCLDMRGMSESEKRHLRGKLTNDYRDINSEYSKLNRSIRKSLGDRQIVPMQLSEVLMELNAFLVHERHKNKPILAECMDEIENAKDVHHVFKILRPYGSFFDCSVIEHIVQSPLCTHEDRKRLGKYKEKLNAYCQRSIYECPHFATPNQEPKFRNLVMKIDDDIESTFTIKALDAFCNRVAKSLNLKGHTLHLCSVKKGCLELIFQVPSFVTDIIFPLSHEQKMELEKLHIQRIECNGIQFVASRSQMTLDIQSTSDSLPTAHSHSIIHSSTGMSGSVRFRCGYIHVDGVERHKAFFTFQVQKAKDANKLCHGKVLLKCTPSEDFGGLIYEKKVDFCHHVSKEKSSLHAMLEIQDRAMNRHLQVFLTEEYMSNMWLKLLESLTWLFKRGLTAKLEGRFGHLPWRQNVDKYDEFSFETEKFVHAAFDDPSSYFLTKVSEEDVEKIKQGCCESIDKLETYDFKLMSNGEKMDIRMKFSEGKPKIVTIKKFEYKVAIFDILCLNRKYDMRVSLNTYQSASSESDIAKRFAATVSMVSPGVISFVPRAQENEWTVAFIRHKKIDTLYFKQPKYVVTVSNVGQLPINVEDLEPGERIIVNDAEYEQRSETEFHNLSWEVAFGHQIGLKPEESLVLFIGQESIPPELYSVIDQGEWTPESVVEEFKKDGFMNMMEDINNILTN